MTTTTTLLEPTMSIAAPQPKPTVSRGRAAFERMADNVLASAEQIKNTPDFAIKSGVNMYSLVHYAAGAESDRAAVRDWCHRIAWCYNVVCALVKGSNDSNSLAYRLLRDAERGNLPPESELIKKLERLAG